MPRVGIPYAHTNPDGTITCPVCGKSIHERHDHTGERTTNNYGLHYLAAHDALPVDTDDVRRAQDRSRGAR
jgi:uncharacterized Zn finger protein (UPF0148 family)